MSTASEQALIFPCHDAELTGVLHRPALAGKPAETGLVIIVGGPQYRAGSHRQFVQTARSVADGGYPVLRFDARGMGDSGGEFPGFEAEEDDIRAAVDALAARAPDVKRVVLWGLCDAASAILLYAPNDARIGGAILVNPWVRDDESHARSQIRHYYGDRWTSGIFWRRLFSGEVNVFRAVAGWVSALFRAAAPAEGPPEDFTARMERGLAAFTGETLLITSGRDLTAQEFLDMVSESAGWARLLDRNTVTRRHLPEADHTFSTRRHREEADALTLSWLRDNF